MATKLEGLHIKKVDFVDQGANQMANIKIKKSKDGEEIPNPGFRPLSGSYISQYHPRNPMSCLGRIGGLRGKSNFIEMQPFWKVKNSHKSSI